MKGLRITSKAGRHSKMPDSAADLTKWTVAWWFNFARNASLFGKVNLTFMDAWSLIWLTAAGFSPEWIFFHRSRFCCSVAETDLCKSHENPLFQITKKHESHLLFDCISNFGPAFARSISCSSAKTWRKNIATSCCFSVQHWPPTSMQQELVQ